MNENGNLYRAVFPDNAHLAPSKGTDGAFRGAILDNATNKLAGQAEFLKADLGDRDFASDPNGGGASVVASAAIGIVVGAMATLLAVQAAPHVRRWWVEDARPSLKAKWYRLTDREEVAQVHQVNFPEQHEVEPPQSSQEDRRSA